MVTKITDTSLLLQSYKPQLQRYDYNYNDNN